MGLDRRTFVQLAVGGVVGTLFTPLPWKLAGDSARWSQNWPWIAKATKGEVAYKNAITKLCPSGCAVSVRTVEGAPTLVQGSKDNPLSQGGVCPACAAAAQLLYSPARIKGPMMKKSPNGPLEPVSWDDALSALSDKLKAVKGKDGKVAMVSGDQTGTSSEVFSAFVAGLGSQDFYLMPSEGQVAAKAWGLMGGAGKVGFDLKNADFVLFLGADAFESWGPMVRNKKTFAAKRPVGQAALASYVYAGPVRSRTAAVCDQYLPVPADALTALGLGLAAQLVQMGKSADVADFAEFKAMLGNFSPDKVEKIAGVKPEALTALAKKLAAAKAPLVIAGSPFGQGEGAATFIAGAALNLLLGQVNKPGGMKVFADFAPVVKGAATAKKLGEATAADYLAKVGAGKASPEVLMVYEANPAYGLPAADAMAKAMEKIPFVVSFATFLDETAQKATLVLPAPHSLERADDLANPYGYSRAAYGVSLPVLKPVADAKSTPDVILALAGKLGLELGFTSFTDVLKAKAEAVGASWGDVSKGKLYTSDATKEVSGLSLATAVLTKAASPNRDPAYPLALAPLAMLNVGTSALATAPQALITIRDTELSGNDMFVQVCAETAKANGLARGAKVKVVSSAGECVARVNVTETVMPGTVAVPLGFGRTAWDKFTRGKGDNLNKVLALSPEPGTGVNVWSDTRVKIAKI
jgi:anaerobic selenocysteine-containing dehydrogenase